MDISNRCAILAVNVNTVSFFCQSGPAKLGLEDAEKACKSFGGNFTVTRKAFGSLICSTVPWHKNCSPCETWRMLVWKDGACEKIKNDYTPCKANLQTKSGHYYCGHKPCTKDADFPEGGTWGARN